MKLCNQCSAQNSDAAIFCSKCGKKLDLTESLPELKLENAPEELEEAPNITATPQLKTEAPTLSQDHAASQESHAAGQDDHAAGQDDHAASQESHAATVLPVEHMQPAVPVPQQGQPNNYQPVQQPAAKKVFSAHPVLNGVKRATGSSVMLILAIVYSVSKVISFGLIGMKALDFGNTGLSVLAATTIAEILFVMPTVLMIIGLWKIFYTANKVESRSTAGLTLVKASAIFNLCFLLILVLLVVVFGVILMLSASKSSYVPELINIIIWVATALILIFCLVIFYYIIMIRVIGSVKSTIITGIPKTNGIVFLGIINLICGINSLFWLAVKIGAAEYIAYNLGWANGMARYIGLDVTSIVFAFIGSNPLQIAVVILGVVASISSAIVLFKYKREMTKIKNY